MKSEQQLKYAAKFGVLPPNIPEKLETGVQRVYSFSIFVQLLINFGIFPVKLLSLILLISPNNMAYYELVVEFDYKGTNSRTKIVIK